MSDSDYVIRVEGLSKRYLVGHETPTRAGYRSLRETIVKQAETFGRNLRDMARGRSIVVGDEIEEFWALKDVSFDVRRGEVIGVIGRNGAGKSTLLKILSRITEPTEGRARIRGRVASLLEVGTGFHNELTGRENIFLNAAILGMTKGEIRSKFDEIVAFAEVEKFIDTPVKRYSSGMYVRLAFSVAAHLDPDILIIDEVLAVGDAEFQKKCLSKLSSVQNEGRTVLFVSHNMNAVERLCHRVLCLRAGRAVGFYDDVREGIVSYLSNAEEVRSVWRKGGGSVRVEHFSPHEFFVASEDSSSSNSSHFSNDFDIVFHLKGDVLVSDPTLNIGIIVYTEDDQVLFWSFTTDGRDESLYVLRPGPLHLSVTLPRRLLNEGTYRVELVSSLHQQRFLLTPNANAPTISFSVRGGLSDSLYWHEKRPGIMAPVLQWEMMT